MLGLWVSVCDSICVVCGQVGLTGSQVWWATDVGIAFERVEEGFETALKDYNKKQVHTHTNTHTLFICAGG